MKRTIEMMKKAVVFIGTIDKKGEMNPQATGFPASQMHDIQS